MRVVRREGDNESGRENAGRNGVQDPALPGPLEETPMSRTLMSMDTEWRRLAGDRRRSGVDPLGVRVSASPQRGAAMDLAGGSGWTLEVRGRDRQAHCQSGGRTLSSGSGSSDRPRLNSFRL